MVAIISDSACDMSPKDFALAGVTPVYGRIRMGAESHLGNTITPEHVAQWVAVNNRIPVVDPPTTEDWEKAYAEALQRADEVLSIHGSRKVSPPAYEAARKAAERFGTRVKMVDSEAVSYSAAFFVQQAVRLADEGKSADQIKAVLTQWPSRVFGVSYLNKLDYLAKSGQLSNLAALLSSWLRVHPILLQKNGEVVPAGQALGRDRANKALLNQLRDFALSHSGKIRVAFMCTAGMEHEAANLQALATTWGIPNYEDLGVKVTSTESFAIAGPNLVGVAAEKM